MCFSVRIQTVRKAPTRTLVGAFLTVYCCGLSGVWPLRSTW